MVGNQGKHSQRVWDERKRKEKEAEMVAKLPKLMAEFKMGLSDEITIRSMIKRQDEKLVTIWFNDHLDVVGEFVEYLKKGKFPPQKRVLEITAKICCNTEFDISHRTVKGVMRQVYEGMNKGV